MASTVPEDVVDPERQRAFAFFQHVSSLYRSAERKSALVVTHAVPTAPLFISALADLVEIIGVLPKPKSRHDAIVKKIEERHPCHALDRDLVRDEKELERLAAPAQTPLVVLDVGGYFAEALGPLARLAPHGLLGAVEDTENGLRHYARVAEDLEVPVLHVARSPLKQAEDHLVGSAIVFSVDAMLRTRGEILYGNRACVLGYGKIGRGIAAALRSHHVTTTVIDTDPIRMTEAVSHGFATAKSWEQVIADCDLVLSATGNHALTPELLAALPNGTYVASATSADDEMGDPAWRSAYRRVEMSEAQHVFEYRQGTRYFYLLNDGEAANFVHGGVLGPSIFLIQAELIAAAAELGRGKLDPGLHELPIEQRRQLAEIWLQHFTDG